VLEEVEVELSQPEEAVVVVLLVLLFKVEMEMVLGQGLLDQLMEAGEGEVIMGEEEVVVMQAEGEVEAVIYIQLE